MKDQIKLGDWKKEPNRLHPKHREDLFYLLLPLTIVSCVLLAAGFVGLLKMLKVIV